MKYTGCYAERNKITKNDVSNFIEDIIKITSAILDEVQNKNKNEEKDKE